MSHSISNNNQLLSYLNSLASQTQPQASLTPSAALEQLLEEDLFPDLAGLVSNIGNFNQNPAYFCSNVQRLMQEINTIQAQLDPNSTDSEIFNDLIQPLENIFNYTAPGTSVTFGQACQQGGTEEQAYIQYFTDHPFDLGAQIGSFAQSAYNSYLDMKNSGQYTPIPAYSSLPQNVQQKLNNLINDPLHPGSNLLATLYQDLAKGVFSLNDFNAVWHQISLSRQYLSGSDLQEYNAVVNSNIMQLFDLRLPGSQVTLGQAIDEAEDRSNPNPTDFNNFQAFFSQLTPGEVGQYLAGPLAEMQNWLN